MNEDLLVRNFAHRGPNWRPSEEDMQAFNTEFDRRGLHTEAWLTFNAILEKRRKRARLKYVNNPSLQKRLTDYKAKKNMMQRWFLLILNVKNGEQKAGQDMHVGNNVNLN